MTRNVDLSVESIIGLVAFVVADLLRDAGRLRCRRPSPLGIGLGLVLGIVNGFLVARPARPLDRRDARHAVALPRLRAVRRRRQAVTLTDLPPATPTPRRATIVGIPLFLLIAVVIVAVVAVIMRQTPFGRQVYAVGSNPEAAEILGIRTPASSPSCVFASAACWPAWPGSCGASTSGRSMPRRPPGYAPGRRRGRRRRRQHLGRLRDRGRGGARRPVPRVHLERADPAAPLAVLAPGDLRRRDPAGGHVDAVLLARRASASRAGAGAP